MNLSPRKKVVVRAAVASVLLSAAAYYAYASVFDPGGDERFYGSVDTRNVSVGFRVSGRVTEVLVDEGSPVVAGQVIARLDAEPYRRAQQESLATRDAAAARLALMESGYDKHAIAQAAAELDENRASLENAERTEARMLELRKTGAQSQRALDDAHTARAEAAARAVASGQELARLRRGYRAEEIDEARANLARAEAAYQRMQLQLDDTELKAPDGGVVQTRAIEPGSFVNAGASGFVIAKTNEAWVRAYVPEPSLGRTVPGARVAIYTDSRPDQPYVGRIGSVSPQAEFTPRTVETTDLRTSLVYRVRVLVDKPDSGLRQGMPVTVRLASSETK
jgi:HlyD family secretion protein